MASTEGSHGFARPAVTFPPKLAGIFRPELSSLADEIVAEIGRSVPDYGEALGEEFRPALRVAVEEALTAFVDQIADPAGAHDRLREVCRTLGENEAAAGRSLDALHAAFRIGVHVAWRRVMKVGRRENLGSSIMSLLAEALFGYIDELATLSLEGYHEATTPPREEMDERRRRLLHLLLETDAVPDSMIVEQGRLAGWSIPGEVTPVAIEPGARWVRALIDDDVLADLDGTQPLLMMPGAPTAARLAMLEAALAGRRAVAGIPVAPAQAAQSLRWARQALALLKAGVITDDGRVTQCEDHLVTLWLLSDTELLDQLANRRFTALAGLTRGQRRRLTETLAAWLEKRGNAVEIADRLQVHPQTVRYRMRQLRATFGDDLDDPDARFALEIVLRAARLRDEATADYQEEDDDAGGPAHSAKVAAGDPNDAGAAASSRAS